MISASDGAAASRAPIAAASRQRSGAISAIACRRGGPRRGRDRRRPDRVRGRGRIAGRIEPHHPLVPAAAHALELPDGDGVEELVGNEDHRAERNLVQPLMPGDPVGRGGEGLALQGSQRRAELDEVDAGGSGEAGAMRQALSRSAISVPRPGPSSTRRTGSGRPAGSQAARHQTPISSPKICDTSGAVMKSPCRPNGSRAM